MTKFEVTYSAPLPAGVTKEQAIKLLHDHVAYFKASSTYRDHSDAPDEAKADDKVPAEIKARAAAGATTRAYKTSNETPNPIVDTSVSTNYTILDLADGMWYFAQSPMGVTNEALWEVRDGASGAELSVLMKGECNMMLKSTVKSNVEGQAEELCKALIAKLQG